MPSPEPAPIIVVMGVSGAGKSTLMAALAARLGWSAQDGDDLHPARNRELMARGVPLTDADRAPWLAAVGAWIDARGGQPAVIACSALKRAYRDQLRAGRPGVRFVWLTGAEAAIAARLAGRTGHFAEPGLLRSQIETLEPPAADEATAIDIGLSTEAQADLALRALGLA